MSDSPYIVNVFICPDCDSVYESLAPNLLCSDCNKDAEHSGWFETTKRERRAAVGR